MNTSYPIFAELRALLAAHKTTQPNEDHYAALGHFISQCSRLEVSLHVVLKHYVGIDEPVARMLIGEPRNGDLIDSIKKFMALRKVDPKLIEVVEEFLSHAAYCNRVRSVVAHKPLRIAQTEMIFHNSMTAKTVPALYEYQTSIEQLKNISEFADNLATIIYSISIPGMDLEIFENHAKYLTSLRTQAMPSDPGMKSPQAASKANPQPRPSRK